MGETPINITFSNRNDISRDCLKIEQEPWGKDVGKTSKAQALLGIAAASHGNAWPEQFCGGANGYFNATIYVYTCEDIGRNYQFKVSHGSVTSQLSQTKYREEIVQASLQLEHNLDYPVQSIGVVSWIGDCYNLGGDRTVHPQVDVADDGTVTFSEKVFGSLRVRYTVRRYAYIVQVSKRMLAIENKYESVAYCVWAGGVKWIDVEAPANFEAFDGDCGNGGVAGLGEDGSTTINPPGGDGDGDGDDGIPEASAEDRKIVYDYCTQELISDSAD